MLLVAPIGFSGGLRKILAIRRIALLIFAGIAKILPGTCKASRHE